MGVNVHVDVVGFSFWLALRHCRLVNVIVGVVVIGLWLQSSCARSSWLAIARIGVHLCSFAAHFAIRQSQFAMC